MKVVPASPEAPPSRKPVDGGSGGGRLAFDAFVFEPQSLELLRDGREVNVPRKSLEVLACLLETPGRVVLKSELLETVWPGTFVSDASLAQAVSQLRHALEDSPAEPKFIQTLHRRGYRFLGEVRSLPSAPSIPTVPRAHAVLPLSDSAPNLVRLGEEPGGRSDPARRTWLRYLAAAALLLGLGGWLGAMLANQPPPLANRAENPSFLSLEIPGRLSGWTPSLAVSPDGTALAFALYETDGSLLHYRPLKAQNSVPLAGTEDAYLPTFTPDGRIAFLAEGKVKITSLSGEAPEILAPVPGSGSYIGLAMMEDGSAILAQYPFGGLWQVGAGREARQLTNPKERGGLQDLSPKPLPGGRWILFTTWTGAPDRCRIEALDLESGGVRTLVEGAHSPNIASSGALVYVRGRELVAVKFDPESLELTSSPMVLHEAIAVNSVFGIAHLAVGGPDTIVFMPAQEGEDLRRLAVIGKDGIVKPLSFAPRHLRGLNVSRDGRRVAMAAFTTDGPGNRPSGSDIWIADVGAAVAVRLTFGTGASNPVLSPDGEQVIFTSHQNSTYNIYRKSTDGHGPAERLLPSQEAQFAHSWAPDGSTLIYYKGSLHSGLDLWSVDLDREPLEPLPLLEGPGDEIFGQISPDGRWLAYASNESGEYEIFVRPYPEVNTGLWLISDSGGGYPQWSRDSRRLFYSANNLLYEVPVEPAPGTTFGPRRLRFEHRISLNWYQTLPDDRVLARDRIGEPAEERQPKVALGWLTFKLG